MTLRSQLWNVVQLNSDRWRISRDVDVNQSVCLLKYLKNYLAQTFLVRKGITIMTLAFAFHPAHHKVDICGLEWKVEKH